MRQPSLTLKSIPLRRQGHRGDFFSPFPFFPENLFAGTSVLFAHAAADLHSNSLTIVSMTIILIFSHSKLYPYCCDKKEQGEQV